MPSEEYIVARRVLLDALDALQEHLDTLVLVGAQAIYLHTGEADLAVAEHTTDADLAIDPRILKPEPEIGSAMRRAGFSLARFEDIPAVGIWSSIHEINGIAANVNVDLLIPQSLGGAGRRAARIPPHEKGAVLKVHGLEAALVDNDIYEICAFEASDKRTFEIRVAGPAALLVSKCIKLGERVDAAANGTGRLGRQPTRQFHCCQNSSVLREHRVALSPLGPPTLSRLM